MDIRERTKIKEIVFDFQERGKKANTPFEKKLQNTERNGLIISLIIIILFAVAMIFAVIGSLFNLTSSDISLVSSIITFIIYGLGAWYTLSATFLVKGIVSVFQSPDHVIEEMIFEREAWFNQKKEQLGTVSSESLYAYLSILKRHNANVKGSTATLFGSIDKIGLIPFLIAQLALIIPLIQYHAIMGIVVSAILVVMTFISFALFLGTKLVDKACLLIENVLKDRNFEVDSSTAPSVKESPTHTHSTLQCDDSSA